MIAIDQPQSVRDGESLDLSRLMTYLEASISTFKGPLQVLQYPSGYSNLTYSLRTEHGNYVLRRPPFGSKVKSAHDMGREFRVLSNLHTAYPPAPQVLHYCTDSEVIGAPFYLMQPIEGIILRDRIPDWLECSPETARRLSECFLENLVGLHKVDYAAIGLKDLGRPQGYMMRQVNGWIDRFHKSGTHEYPYVKPLEEWLLEHLPTCGSASLIHNDYKYDNVVLDPTDASRIIGVLDWEMSTIGDPLADLGTLLAYWTEAGDSAENARALVVPTTAPGSLTRADLVKHYASLTGADVSGIVYYVAFARFKIAVILQQIYYRFHHGLTTDQRFVELPGRVEGLLCAAWQCAQSGKV